LLGWQARLIERMRKAGNLSISNTVFSYCTINLQILRKRIMLLMIIPKGWASLYKFDDELHDLI
jgi:hypothetical protein